MLAGTKYTEAVESANAAYSERNPKSREAHEHASNYFPGGNTRSSLLALPFPLVFASGDGTYLTSVDGDRYIDFLGEYSAGIFGHNHPVIRRAINDAMEKGWNYGGHSTFEARLAEMVCKRFGPTIELVRFTNSGTEANMCAIATAMVCTGRKSIMVFDGAYHGSTIGFSRFYGSNKINLPHQWVHGSYDNIEQTKSALETVSDGGLAAILIEPMQGNAGARPCSVEFLQFLRAYATEAGALLIFDEVQASRLSYHGYNQKLGVRPDMMTLGKWIGGGLTFGAFGGRRGVMEIYNPRIGNVTHAGTFNNNVFSMAAGVAGLELIDEKRIERLNALGFQLKKNVDQLLHNKGILALEMSKVSDDSNTETMSVIHQEKESLIASENLKPYISSLPSESRMSVSAVGSILNIGFNGPGSEQLQSLFYHHMLTQNIYLASRGFITLNIEMNDSHIQAFVEAVSRFTDKYMDFLEGAES
ncbi:MAG: hypothetical protein LQ340_006720 [Diploschistes diacapsis]|nr:MAG: hypothetical protein LQ340_006720 [Diploschistes diacapsis]